MFKHFVLFVVVLVLLIALPVLAGAHDLTDYGGGGVAMLVAPFAASGGAMEESLVAGAAHKKVVDINIVCSTCSGSFIRYAHSPSIGSWDLMTTGSGSTIIPHARDRPVISFAT